MNPAVPSVLRFTKMHGAGNDFVVIDRRASTEPLPAAWIAQLCDRHRGVGCDQLLTIDPPRSPGALLAYGIWNADGSASGQCGNGARCIVAWAQRDGGVAAGESFTMDSPSGPVAGAIEADGTISVLLQTPDFAAGNVPKLEPDGAQHVIKIGADTLLFDAVSMGNPHAVIQVASVADVNAARIAPAIQADPRFPEGCNVGFVEVLTRTRIRLRVVERGVGETLACGSGACAAMVSLARRGLLDSRVAVELPGGTLDVEWPDGSAPVRLRGPTAFVFEGEWWA